MLTVFTLMHYCTWKRKIQQLSLVYTPVIIIHLRVDRAEKVLQKVMVDWVWCWMGIRQKYLQNTDTWITMSHSMMGVSRLEAAKKHTNTSVKQRSPCILLRILSLHFCIGIKHLDHRCHSKKKKAWNVKGRWWVCSLSCRNISAFRTCLVFFIEINEAEINIVANLLVHMATGKQIRKSPFL